MKIQRATFLGVLGVGDATLDLTDHRTGAPHETVVITGPSGSGKTRMIEALIAAKEAIGAYGLPPVGGAWIGAGNAAKVLVTFHLDKAEQDYAGSPSATLDAEVIFETLMGSDVARRRDFLIDNSALMDVEVLDI